VKWKKFKIWLTQVVHFCCCIIVHFLQSAPWLWKVITNGNGFCMRPEWPAINISPWVQVHSVFLGALFMQPAQCIGIWVIARVYRRVEVFPCPASGSRASRTRFHSRMPSDIRSRRIFSFCSICTRRVNDNNSNLECFTGATWYCCAYIYRLVFSLTWISVAQRVVAAWINFDFETSQREMRAC
jgi:hypothetical protein